MTRVECVLDAKATLGESAVWDVQEAALFWTDIEGGRVHRFDPASGEDTVVDVGERVGCLALRAAGGAVIATESGVYALDLSTGARERIADPEHDRPDNRFNDGAVDPAGRWWIGSCSMRRPQPAQGAFWRLDPDHAATLWLDGVYTTNGLAFSPDGRTMYHSDSFPQVRQVWACDYDAATGTPSNRRPFFDTRTVAGRPDGATVDAQGCYWLAGVSGWQVYRITPDGRLDMTVDVPVERPSRPMFGGRDLSTLYVTTIRADLSTDVSEQPLAGGVFAITGLSVGGVPQPRFAG